MPFSIIIATCNRPDRLANALRAVEQAVAANGGADEVIVADNGPDRPARDVVSAFAATLPFPVRRVEAMARNKAAALNAGIRAAANDWLAFTDDDCLPDENWLRAAQLYAATANVGLFSGRLQAGPVHFALPRWLRHEPHTIIEWSPAFVDFSPLPQSGILADDGRVPFGANIFVAKRIFETHGGYDEALWNRCGAAALGSEDAEFAMRVRAAGENIGYCAESLVVHPVYPERTTLRYYLKHVYHAGVREPLFTPPGTRAPMAWLGRSLCVALVRSAGWALRADAARGVRELMNAARDWGELRGWRRLRTMQAPVSPVAGVQDPGPASGKRATEEAAVRPREPLSPGS